MLLAHGLEQLGGLTGDEYKEVWPAVLAGQRHRSGARYL